MSASSSNEDIFEIAAKAEKLLKEILSTNKLNSNLLHSVVKQEPVKQEPVVLPQSHPNQHQPQANPAPIHTQNGHFYPNMVNTGTYYQQQVNLIQPNAYSTLPPQTQYIYPPTGPGHGQVDASYFMKTPPPIVQPQIVSRIAQPYYYQIQNPNQIPYYQVYNPYQQNPTYIQQIQPQIQYQAPPYAPTQYGYPTNQNTTNPFYRKRKFGEINNYTNFNRFNKTNNPDNSSNGSYQGSKQSQATSSLSENVGENGAEPTGSSHNDDEDLNLMRERELKDLKCKSVVEKMSVFLRYYQQFKESYIIRIQSIECSDSLKVQFHSLIKYLNEYETLLIELELMITEHERDHCKNNHRKTKKFFNKTKAFIRYECNKRLQTNIFEYRRLINSQDRYAGMYDLLDMNSYLISLLPDIGVSIRRYINRCEKAKEQEFEDDEYQTWHSENSNDSTNNDATNDASDITIPSFKEFVAQNGNDEEFDENSENKKRRCDSEENGESSVAEKSTGSHRQYESFSKGVDSLNRYLLKRVEDEESLDELVKERIIKWINKRQAKYILIFSDVDKLLNQHKGGECYPKFHSYLLFNLGKLVTVCDSYHQKLKELLYSTTIRRKKKRKKVKLLPEAMTDVFDEITDLKRALDYAKVLIKRCTEHKSLTNSNKETKSC